MITQPLLSHAQTGAPTLSTVDARALAATGITLAALQIAPLVSRAAAEQVALRQFPGFVVREAVHASVSQRTVPSTKWGPNTKALLSRNAWIVSIMPPGGLQY